MASKLAGGEVVLDHGTFKADQPPLAPKRKLKIDRKKSNVEWQWAPFTNQAREDGLVRCRVCSIRGRSALLRDRSRSSRSQKAVGGLDSIFEPFWGVSRCLTYSTTHRFYITGKKKAWNLPSTPTLGLIRSSNELLILMMNMSGYSRTDTGRGPIPII